METWIVNKPVCVLVPASFLIADGFRTDLHNNYRSDIQVSVCLALTEMSTAASRSRPSVCHEKDKKVVTTWIFLQHSPTQGHFAEEVGGYSEQLGSGYKWGRSIRKVGKVAILHWVWLMWAQCVCSSTHGEPALTVSTATFRMRKPDDLGGIMTKCLTTEALRSGLGQGRMSEHKEHVLKWTLGHTSACLEVLDRKWQKM